MGSNILELQSKPTLSYPSILSSFFCLLLNQADILLLDILAMVMMRK